MQCSPPPGMKDYSPDELNIRKKILNVFETTCSLRGAKLIDTPTLEFKSTVHQLYGEEFNKLVYNIEDPFGEGKLMMRYDLTVPFIRYVAEKGIKMFKRMQYGTVYRRDTPQVAKGRLRAFMQADMDIIGDDQGSRIFDIEIIDTLYNILEKLLEKDTFILNINNRILLNDIATYAKIDDDKFIDMYTCLDKLDKKSWSDIKKEMIERKISDESIDILDDIYKTILKATDNKEIIDYFVDKKIINKFNLNDLEIIFDFCKRMNFTNIVFSPFLARGMDYYTGIIFEVTYKDKDIAPFTIASGGRYDKMVGKFSNYGDIPAIGFSLGVDRIQKILELKQENKQDKKYDVFIASIGEKAVIEKMILYSELQRLNIKVLISHHISPKMREQFNFVFENNIPYMVVIGEDEIKKNMISVKNIQTKIQTLMKKEELINLLINQ